MWHLVLLENEVVYASKDQFKSQSMCLRFIKKFGKKFEMVHISPSKLDGCTRLAINLAFSVE